MIPEIFIDKNVKRDRLHPQEEKPLSQEQRITDLTKMVTETHAENLELKEKLRKFEIKIASLFEKPKGIEVI